MNLFLPEQIGGEEVVTRRIHMEETEKKNILVSAQISKFPVLEVTWSTSHYIIKTINKSLPKH